MALLVLAVPLAALVTPADPGPTAALAELVVTAVPVAALPVLMVLVSLALVQVVVRAMRVAPQQEPTALNLTAPTALVAAQTLHPVGAVAAVVPVTLALVPVVMAPEEPPVMPVVLPEHMVPVVLAVLVEVEVEAAVVVVETQ